VREQLELPERESARSSEREIVRGEIVRGKSVVAEYGGYERV